MHREIGMTLVAKGPVFSLFLNSTTHTHTVVAHSTIMAIGRRQRECHEQQRQDPSSQLRRGDGQSARYLSAPSLGRAPPPSCVCLASSTLVAVSSGHLMITEIKDPQNEMRRGTDASARASGAQAGLGLTLSFQRCSGAEGHVGRPHQLLCSIRYALPPQ